jgi:hypothetical protein
MHYARCGEKAKMWPSLPRFNPSGARSPYAAGGFFLQIALAQETACQ